MRATLTKGTDPVIGRKLRFDRPTILLDPSCQDASQTVEDIRLLLSLRPRPAGLDRKTHASAMLKWADRGLGRLTQGRREWEAVRSRVRAARIRITRAANSGRYELVGWSLQEGLDDCAAVEETVDEVLLQLERACGDAEQRFKYVHRAAHSRLNRLADATQREAKRRESVAVRAARVDPQSRDIKCASCGKRDRRFDDLCKKCAHQLGVRPHGPIR